jgi:hypothetical protein
VPVRLITIDTLAKTIPGENENDASVMNAVVCHAATIAAETGAAVQYIHHPGKDKERGMRGNSAGHAGFDVVAEVDDGTVKIRKSRDGAEGFLFSFSLEEVEIGEDAEGDPITSCIVKETNSAPKHKPRRPDPESQAGKALNELEHLGIAGKGHRSKLHPRIPDDVFVFDINEWKAACKQKRLSEGDDEGERKAFNRAKKALSQANLIGDYNSSVWLTAGHAEFAEPNTPNDQ